MFLYLVMLVADSLIHFSWSLKGSMRLLLLTWYILSYLRAQHIWCGHLSPDSDTFLLYRVHTSDTLRNALAQNPTSLVRCLFQSFWNLAVLGSDTSFKNWMVTVAHTSGALYLIFVAFYWKEKTNNEDQWLLPSWCLFSLSSAYFPGISLWV